MNKSLLDHVLFVACPEMTPIAERIRVILAKDHPGMHPRVITIKYEKFASGEYIACIPESVRNHDVLLFHAFQPDPMTSYMKFLIAADALRLGNPRSIKPVLPFIPFQRQDRKDQPRVPITAKLVWKLMDNNKKIDSSITLDLHCEQEQAYSENSTDNFPGVRIVAKYLCTLIGNRLNDFIIISPDLGSSKRIERLRDRILELTGVAMPVGVIDKRRPAPGIAKVKNYHGENPSGKTAILYDDMIDSGGSSIAAADYMRELGAVDALLVATHGIFSPAQDKKVGIITTAEEKLRNSGHRVLVTNSIPREDPYVAEHKDWLTIIPIEETFAVVIDEAMRIGGSVSKRH
jgi:ribose-phosphate pyrophosphokinase